MIIGKYEVTFKSRDLIRPKNWKRNEQTRRISVINKIHQGTVSVTLHAKMAMADLQ